ncbi:MAG: PorP/SprF family type IX secretion system membrane protein [Bacteroidetes bacterium]|nr:PorP/SprF family type IX secretion system membrane protein [Bacteroidota bacterium]MCA6442469.1 PorP/SprF family type IX secretion system membrane protein [Bacteroidota bacterium]
MKRVILYLIFGIGIYKAQQFPQYTQFLFNKIGYNPAASGTVVRVPFELIFGGRTQWIGLSNNPRSAFVSANYNFVPQRSYKRWHNVGVYLAQDQNGVYRQTDYWLSYTIHLLASSRWLISAGVFAGVKNYRIEKSSFDLNDPAVNSSAGSVWAIPDVVPGLRLTNKRFFYDLAIQHAAIRKRGGLGGTIGTPSRILLNYNTSIGTKIKITDFDNLVLAVNVKGGFTSIPNFEFNVMNYYNKRLALGMSLRVNNFISGIVQFRLLHNWNVGLAYDLSINRLLRTSPHTAEIMISFSPIFGGEVIEKTTKYSVNECSF